MLLIHVSDLHLGASDEHDRRVEALAVQLANSGGLRPPAGRAS